MTTSHPEAGSSTDSVPGSAPSPRSEALAALQLWQTFEYLSPQNPPDPKVEKDNCVWALDPHAQGDRDMPWAAPDKVEALNKFFRRKRRFMLFAGLISGKELVDTLRDRLGAPPLDFTEQRAPKSAASFVIPIDEHGRVGGEIFVSSVPWAVARIEAARAGGGLFDFSGFFGDGGVQQRIRDAVSELLRMRQLIDDESVDEDESAEDAACPPGVDAGPGDEQEDLSPAVDPFAEGAEEVDVPPNIRTLEAEDVRAIAEVVFRICGWQPSNTPDWIIQTQRASAKGENRLPDDPLNSFFAEELEKVQREYVEGRCGATLSRFLETPVHPDRCDLDRTRQHLVDGVHPSLTPLACWPGEFPLVTAQQFAVNTIMRELGHGGLFSVNGPPGTGKTTMLKDILAAIVAERADVLASFVKPLDAFPSRLKVERHEYPVWKIHDRLRGFGIVVGCANNGAAENISKELPSRAAIDKSMDIDYFSEVADSLGLPENAKQRPGKHWGLVSAALGRQENRFAFATDFWNGRRDGGKTGARSKRSGQDETSPDEPADPMRLLTLQDWVEEFGRSVPAWDEARASYAQARERAHAALERAGSLASRLRASEQSASRLLRLRPRHAELTETVSGLTRQEAEAQAQVRAAGDAVKHATDVASALRESGRQQANLEDARDRLAAVLLRRPSSSADALTDRVKRIDLARRRVQDDLKAHELTKPGVLSVFFRRAGAQQWEARRYQLLAELDAKRREQDACEQARDDALRWQRERSEVQARIETAQAKAQAVRSAMQALGVDTASSFDEASARLHAVEEDLRRHQKTLQDCRQASAQAASEAKALAVEIGEQEAAVAAGETVLSAAGLLGECRAAWHLFDVSRDDFHRAAPYHDEAELFDARRDLFAAALNLHKAFIVHAWRRLKPTLFGAIGLLNGRINVNQIHGGPMPLWDALFLVVPLVSTTFASFPRLFRGVGKEQLAWVLIDEAGQAPPQYCAGALWRARRAVVVGDPRQLEPVVGVPDELTDPLRERCGAAVRHMPPAASAQTLADLSNRYGMYLNEDDPESRIWLGSPLIVHRRCVAPMFEIANAIAYEGKMVYGAGTDRLGEAVPWSRWLDASSEANEGHWIPEQGRRAFNAMDILVGDKPRDREGKPRAFVITPFSEVAEKMRELLASRYGWEDANAMCGTVHTFQGKEADYVVFLLGGDPRKPGAISSYAGRSPNLINVAVTRAKKRLYVLGKRGYWTGRGDVHGYFGEMARALDAHLDSMRAKGGTDTGQSTSSAEP
ncbi:MAG: AAA domain-containing protein [Burkholderiaceae bacterium]